MFVEHGKNQSPNFTHADEATKATTSVRTPRNTMPKKQTSSQQISMKILRSQMRPSARRKNRASRVTGRENMMAEKERKAFLESDNWTGIVTEVTAECRPCKNTISLDKRLPTLLVSGSNIDAIVPRSGVLRSQKLRRNPA